MSTVRIKGVIQNTREISTILPPAPYLFCIHPIKMQILYTWVHILYVHTLLAVHLCSPQNRIGEVKSKQKKETNINLKSRQRGMWGDTPHGPMAQKELRQKENK